MSFDYYQKASKKGCARATHHLGQPSLCFDCPFPECYDGIGIATYKKRLRNAEIVDLSKAGMAVKELASLFSVSERTIERIELCQTE